jgi:iron(II)-dependent oxidoreductase
MIIPTETLVQWVNDARDRTLALYDDLDDEQLFGPRLAIVNPGAWELGHIAWFQEKWIERHARGLPARDDRVDGLYDSAAVPHDVRWNLPLPSRSWTRDYLEETRASVVRWLGGGEPSASERYFVALSVFHEDMHAEALLYTRQTLAYAAPAWLADEPRASAGPLTGDVLVPGGRFLLGASEGEPFVFDNEKWAHAREVGPFAIARAPVTQGELAAFVDGGGYARRELWSDAGWRWRCETRAEHPVYWRRGPRGWQRRGFDRWVPLEPHRPALHVAWFEAEAYCALVGRRLPTELEWEVAAAAAPDGDRLAPHKRRYPWGEARPDPERAQLGMRDRGCLDVAALAAGESAFGCRQMMGGAWEWTASDFHPYPGFVRDPYAEYSEPWFATHKVLRGGSFATQARLVRNTWRNFYTPDRRDVWAGFRTCAVGAP